ncbi:MAG: flagellar motor protein MotB [Desulfobacteraceae bacterium]|jgi:chemotaxis protein MotB|nr:flagellar motor protein MotB [Desulfobacteraceae bacterium]
MSDDVAPIEEEEEGGAPAWVVTFGDLMSLLLCFFVLLLSFSEMDRNRYRVVSGSVKNAFGIQRKKPIFDSPRGSKMIAREFDQSIVLTKIEDIIKPIIDELDDEFEEFKAFVEIESAENKVTIRMMGEATFDTGKADLRPNFIPLLRKIGEVLAKTRGEIIVAGHTDNVPLIGGLFRSNLGLSMARAGAVAEFLLRSSAINPQQLSAMGFGEYRPLASNDTAAGRQKNRRVEIILTM